MRERRRHVEWRPRISRNMSRGWLVFEATDGERRRLAPIPNVPNGWDCAATQELRTWLETSEPVPPVRRLIE
jgi:hypothetical protein